MHDTTQLKPMTPQQICDLIEWLNQQAMTAHRQMKDSKLTGDVINNQYFEGMRNGFIEAIKGLTSAQDINPNQ